MPYKKSSIWSALDWFSILLYITMIISGWFSICGASYEFENVGWFNPSGRPGSQLIWIALSFVLIFIILMMDGNFFNVFAYAIYAIVVFVLILTIFIAPDIKGSHSWLVLGPYLRIQPAEFAKFATALALAKFMSAYGFRLKSLKNYAIALSLICFPFICILLQKETGSALIFMAFFLMLYREGMSGYVLLAGINAITFFVISLKYSESIVGITPLGEMITLGLVQIITVILGCIVKPNSLQTKIFIGITVGTYTLAYIASEFIPINFIWVTSGLLIGTIGGLIFLAIKNWIYNYLLVILFAGISVGFIYSVDYVFDKMLEPHQQTRIKVSLGLEDDPRGVGYNVNQSKIAIGSGGFLGKGFLNGTQTKLKYVPEQDTDFIFCTVGEEKGFMGSSIVIILFTIFIIRLYILAEKQKTVFARIYGYCVASIFFIHVLINIGMVTGITPVIGIPLPFFSYGGSSLWGFTLLLFIFLRLDATRKER
ncbi:MAG: rod shape-determining protein RodA [Tannerellaceae bacterium]|jgi:rod shape determining protein RodA|nr:rod shape-determining protein RodA [Tannerellaceae bacterium]